MGAAIAGGEEGAEGAGAELAGEDAAAGDVAGTELGAALTDAGCGAFCSTGGFPKVGQDSAGVDGEGLDCCADTTPTARNAVIINLQARIAQSSLASVRQLENHVYDRPGIDGLSIAHGRLETHFVGGVYGGLIQSVTHAAHHTIYVQLPVGPEHDFEEHFTL